MIPVANAKGGARAGGGGGYRGGVGSRGSGIRSSISRISTTGRIRDSIRRAGSSSYKSASSSISGQYKSMHYIPEYFKKIKLEKGLKKLNYFKKILRTHSKIKLAILKDVAFKMNPRRYGSGGVGVVPIVIPASNYKKGLYNNYNYRKNFNETIGETCENNLDFDGVVFGKFICPIEGLNYFFASLLI
jgi:hypothetical protein